MAFRMKHVQVFQGTHINVNVHADFMPIVEEVSETPINKMDSLLPFQSGGGWPEVAMISK